MNEIKKVLRNTQKHVIKNLMDYLSTYNEDDLISFDYDDNQSVKIKKSKLIEMINERNENEDKFYKGDMLKLFIDDERGPVTRDWLVAKSSDEAIKLVKKYGIPIVLQFDNDLGGDDTSMVFINWLINYMLDNDLTFHKNFRFDIHSQNPVGVLNIKSKMDSFIKSIS